MFRRSFIVFLALILATTGAGSVWLWREERTTGMHVLDVGQGDAILLRSGSVDVLVDGGPDASVLQALGAVRPFWDRRLDVVLLTHPQEDHVRGLLDILERENVGLVLLPEIPAASATFKEFIRRLHERRIPVHAVRAGTELRHGDLRIRALAPDRTLLERARKNANHGSIVLRVDAPQFSALLTGDVEAPTEQHLVRTTGGLLDVDVLKVPHHGSKTSSTTSFLRAISPALSVMSLGKGNRYGHPHDVVVRRYTPQSLLRTDLVGTVSLIARGNRVVLRCVRSCLENGTRK